MGCKDHTSPIYININYMIMNSSYLSILYLVGINLESVIDIGDWDLLFIILISNRLLFFVGMTCSMLPICLKFIKLDHAKFSREKAAIQQLECQRKENIGGHQIIISVCIYAAMNDLISWP